MAQRISPDAHMKPRRLLPFQVEAEAQLRVVNGGPLRIRDRRIRSANRPEERR